MENKMAISEKTAKALSIYVNSHEKAKRICKARNGFYEVFYGNNWQKFYVVYYKPLLI